MPSPCIAVSRTPCWPRFCTIDPEGEPMRDSVAAAFSATTDDAGRAMCSRRSIWSIGPLGVQRPVPPILTGRNHRSHAAIFSFQVGLTPPMPLSRRRLCVPRAFAAHDSGPWRCFRQCLGRASQPAKKSLDQLMPGTLAAPCGRYRQRFQWHCLRPADQPCARGRSWR